MRSSCQPDGLADADCDGDALLLVEGEVLALGDSLCDGEDEALRDGLTDGDAEADTLGVLDAEELGESDALGLLDAERLDEVLGLREALSDGDDEAERLEEALDEADGLTDDDAEASASQFAAANTYRVTPSAQTTGSLTIDPVAFG